MLPEQQQQRILGYFIEEAKDHLNTIEQGLLNLQATIVNPEMANEVFRAAHSVKGGAAMLGIESMQRTAHRMEDYFKLLKEAPIKVDRALESMFLQVFDALQELLEQLQGPFGLTEDKEQSIMASVEPVFQRLQEHLDQLVADADTNEVLEEVAPVAFTTTTPSPQPVEESALKLVFSSDVSAALREMLARFKQADTDDSRSALEACCQMLERFGEQFNLPTWMNLVKHARWAVCDRNNDYRTLAPVLIKEIKKAQDLVLAGREREIVLSQKLQALAAQPDSADTTDSLDSLFADDALFSTNEPEDTSASLNVDEIDLGSSLSIDDLDTAPSSTDEGISIDDLLNNAATNPSGPEVGAAELTSLADLFEAGGDALDSDWQEEEVPINESTAATESLDIDISPDFEDLLNDDSTEAGNNLSDFESGNELADLFGDSDPPGTDLESVSSDLEDWPQPPTTMDMASDIGDNSLDGLFDTEPVAEDTGTSVNDLFNDLGQSSTEAEASLPELASDSLDDLTSSVSSENTLADIDLDLDSTALSLDTDTQGSTSISDTSEEPALPATDSFFGEIDETASAAGTETGQSEFDDFFTINAVNTDTSVEATPEPLEDDLWNVDNETTDSGDTPAALNNLSDDLWADDENQTQSIDTGDLTTNDFESTTASPEPLTQDEDIPDLDDVWASVEDIDLDADTSDLPAPEVAIDTDISEIALGDLFSDDTPTTSDQSVAADPSSDDVVLDDLFGDGAETATNSIDGIAEVATDGLDGLMGGNDPEPTEALDNLFDTEISLESGIGIDESAPAEALDNLMDEPAPAEDALDSLFGNEDSLESAIDLDDQSDSSEALDNLFDNGDSAESGIDLDESEPAEDALDSLFGNEDSMESAIDLEQPDSSEALDNLMDESEPASDLDSLFDNGDSIEATTDVDGAEPAEAIDNLFDNDDFLAEGSIDIDVPDNDLGDLAFATTDVELADGTDANTNTDSLSATPDDLTSTILDEPPSSVDFDLLDLEDDGIVTGFVNDEDALETSIASNLIESPGINLLSDPTLETSSVTEDSDLDITAPVLDELVFESSLHEVASEPSHEVPVDIEDFLDASSSSEQDQENLASLPSDLPELIEENPLPEGSNAGTNEFGDLEALLDTPEESSDVASPQTADDKTDIEDEFGDLEALLQEADQTLTTTASSPASYRPTATRLSSRRMVTDQTMRVSVSHLDNLSNLVGELVVNRNTLEQDQERLRQFLDNLLFQVQQLNDVGQRMRDLYERSLLESSLISSRQSYHMASAGPPVESDLTDHATGESFDALEMDRFTGFHTLSQEMIELIVRVRESASDIAYTVESSDQVTRQFRQVTNQLQEGLNKARMVPFAQAASRLPRAVRDISVKCGKEARLVVEGRDILIDKMILEQLYDPMTHLVNNAITHGVETPEERRSAGKAPEGVITVRAFYQGNQTVISVGDDGAGINPNVVKQKALQKGLISQTDVQTMTVLDVYDLLFHPGFSTRDQADDFAGRGFGMDVVRTSLADIRGNITIDSELGQGTNFTIRLPLTLSISKALSCISNQARIAFPMDGVEDMFDVSRERIQKNDQEQDCILWRDTLLPFQNLSDLLSFNRTLGRGRVYGGNQDENMISIVVLRSSNSFIALEVDQVMGEQEIVIKQLEGPVPKPTGIAGATVLGDGRVMPIADVLELIDLALGRVRREPTAAVWSQLEESPPQEELAKVKSEPTVLIVDDSITVRELLSMSFNKVGYRVEQARDGQEAWEKLRSGLPCDLVFCDIEMPRMDGLELLSRLQKDSGLQQIPIAMLTSRGADRHRQMAVDLGASGYFTKPYLEEALLDAANKMLHGEKLV